MHNDFQEAWYWLANHPIFQEFQNNVFISRFQRDLYMEISKVNPNTMEIEDEESLNTQLCIILEHGPFNGVFCESDPDLECRGSSYEEAVLQLSRLVFNKYGNYVQDQLYSSFLHPTASC